MCFPHVRQAIDDAWRRAGLSGVDAMDGIETHDCFTTTEYMAIDHFGLTPPGQSWQAVEDGRIEPGGRLPGQPERRPDRPVATRWAPPARACCWDAARQVTGRAEACQIEGARRMQTLNIGGSCATVLNIVVEAGAA